MGKEQIGWGTEEKLLFEINKKLKRLTSTINSLSFTDTLSSLSEIFKIGSGSDYTEFATDGTIRYRGDATVWKDMVSDLSGRRLSSTAGKIGYDYENNAIDFQSGGAIANEADRVGGNMEINHEFKVGTNITFKPHIHWFQDAATAYELTVRYRLQRNNTLMTTAWTTVTLTAGVNDVWAYPGSGIFNNITRFPDITVDCDISDTIQFQIARTDSLGGNMIVYFMDMHGEVDSDGSDEEISKRV